MSLAKLMMVAGSNAMRAGCARGLATAPSSLTKIASSAMAARPFARSYSLIAASNHHGIKTGSKCSCGSCRYASGAAALQGDKELVEFLQEEVQAEKQISKIPKQGPGVPGFKVLANGANVTLTKELNGETITVKFTVNGTVDTDTPAEDFREGKQPSPDQLGEMKSKPDFTIEIKKPNGKTLAFNCRLYGDEHEDLAEAEDDTRGDKFEVESFTILSSDEIDEAGDWDENVYLGDGGIIDGQMYDLLLNYLDERGIGAEFADHLVDYSTYYEHTQYVNLLDKLKSFIEGK